MSGTRDGKPASFDIGNGRAMVSLGPLSPRRFCTYACAFCYVHAGFSKYPSMSVTEIREYLAKETGRFDIIYVSGDTDSLAAPRTEKGLELVDALATLGTDVLFTTRAPLEEKHLDRLASTSRALQRGGKTLFGCVSISRLRSAPHLEPQPVPAPERRLEVLKGLYERGVVAVLALRPFLPVVPPEEYVEIAARAAQFVDVVLGEVWYADADGVLERQVLGRNPTRVEFKEHEMDFDSNRVKWKVYEGEQARASVAAYCAGVNVPFFMRSGPAVEYVRAKRERRVQGVDE